MYGLLGKKLGHSYSKIIHEKLGYSYDLIEKSPDELAAFLSAREFSGLNVTIPYKKEVMKYCDEISGLAARIGAVNTLYFGHSADSSCGGPADAQLIGTNTDYTGLSYAVWRAGISLSGRKVLILGGTGGAGSMAKVLAADEDAREVVIASRNAAANDPSFSYCTYDTLPDDAEIIINATPVGTYPDITDSPVDLSRFDKCAGVVDLIYNPLRTDLLMQARDLKIRHTNGLAMLVRQATAAAEFFHSGSGNFASRTEEILKELESSIENIVLIGMPGCGKSSIGRILAKRTGRVLSDTDEKVREISGRTPAEIIKADGEEAFRKIETEAVRLLSKEHSHIIATGGGVVTRKENVRLLKQNGRLFFLDRDPDKLSTYNRPLSQNGGVYRIYEERYPVYRSCCDVRIENNSEDFIPAAEKILYTIKKG